MAGKPPLYSFRSDQAAPTYLLGRSAGFSLVELLIATTLSLFLTVAMLSFFLSHKATHNAHNALSQLQENTRYLHSYLGQEVRLAGFLGCSFERTGWRSALEGSGDPWDFDTYPLGVSGHRFDPTTRVWQPRIGVSTHLPVNLINADPDSDVLVFRRVATQTLALTPGMIRPLADLSPVAAVAPSIARSITIDKPSGVLLVANNCRDQAILFSACRITGSNHQRQLHFTGGTECRPSNAVDSDSFAQLLTLLDASSAELGRLQARAYYLNRNHELVEAHFNDSGDYDTQPVVRGVESFRVSFIELDWANSKEDLNDDHNNDRVDLPAQPRYFFRAPDEVERWDQITALRLDLVLSDLDLTPPLKRSVSWVLQLRNRETENAAL